MNRKKANIMLIISVLFMYAVSMYTAFSSATSVEGGNFTRTANMLENYFYASGDGNENSSPQDFVNRFIRNSDIADYPFTLVVYDRSGNVAARSGTIISTYCEDNNGNINEKTYNIEKYFTDEIKQQVTDFEKSIRSYIIGYKLTYKENGGNIIPVDFTIGSADLTVDGNKKITLHLSDEKSDQTIIGTNPDYIYFDMYGVGEDKADQRIYDRFNTDCQLDNETLKYIADMGEDNQSGGGSLSNENLECSQVIKCSDDYYYAVLKVKHNIYHDTLKYYFSGTAVSLSLIFILAGGILIAAINKMITKNERINTAKETFASAAAHELKTPIAVIQNQCECYMESIAPEKNSSYVESIYEESKRMNKLVMSLLQYNRVAMATNVKKEKISLSETVKTEIEKYMPLIEAKGIRLSADIRPDITITANKELIALVADNYLSNAIKYGDGNEIYVNLDNCRLSVFNTGIRIETQNKKDLWEIFFRNDMSRTRQDDSSTGLGLAISKQILLLHKYRYGYINKPNGVEFYFSFN